MGKRCCLCGIDTIFFVWSSSRDFPIDKLADAIKLEGKSKAEFIKKNPGEPVCFKCYNSMIKDE